MIKIIRAKQWFKWDTLSDTNASPIQGGGDPYLRHVFLSPKKPYTIELVNIDSLSQGDKVGNENEVFHLKYEGEIFSASSWTEGRYTYDPVSSGVSYSYNQYLKYWWPDGYYEATEDSFFVSHPAKNPKASAYLSTRKMYNLDDNGYYDMTVTQYYSDGTTRTWDYFHQGPLSVVSPPSHSIDINALKQNVWSSDSGDKTPNKNLYYYADPISKMFVDCCHGIMPMETNNVANVLQIIAALKDISKAIGKLGEAGSELMKHFDVSDIQKYLRSDEVPKELLKKGANPKAAANAWLAYRYSYLTTKSDIDVHRTHLREQLRMWSNANKRRTRRMHSTTTVDDTTYHMTVDITPRLSNAVEELWVKSRAFGLQLNAVNLWDLVPFSFVADWIVPVSDYLQVLDDSVMFNSTHFNFGPVVVSAKQVSQFNCIYGHITRTSYTRTILDRLPTLEYTEEHDPSTKTKVYRGLDGVSLTVGSIT